MPLGTLSFVGEVTSVTTWGKHALVTTPSSRVEVIDIAHPAARAPLASIALDATVVRAVRRGDVVYAVTVADGYSLNLIDVSDWERPVTFNTIGIPGDEFAVLPNAAVAATSLRGAFISDPLECYAP